MNKTIFWGITARQLLPCSGVLRIGNAFLYDLALSISQRSWSKLELYLTGPTCNPGITPRVPWTMA